MESILVIAIVWYCIGVLSAIIGCIVVGTDDFTVVDLLWSLSVFGLMGPLTIVCIIAIYLSERGYSLEDIRLNDIWNKVLIKSKKNK